nr:hypothetical protein [Tanacetum cinerariifolium]
IDSENSDDAIESFSPSPIPVEDSDSLMEEIDLSLTLDDSMPPEIDLSLTLDDSMPSRNEEDDYDSERDILILEELLSNDSLLFPKNESFHFDIPSSPRPPTKLQDDDEVKPNSGIVTVKVVKSSHWQYKFPLLVKAVATARRLEMPLPEDCTAIEVKKKKLPVKDRWQLH